MSEQIARSAARVDALDEELEHQAGDHRPDAERDAKGEQRPSDRHTPARPSELYKAGMFSLLATVQVAWLAAIAYGIFVVLH